MQTKQVTLFEESRLSQQEAIELTAMYLNNYFDRYKTVAIAFSGGKDSSALVSTVIHLIETKKVKEPDRLTVVYADTRMELPPLQQSAMSMLAEVRKRGFDTKIAIAPLDKRFLVYILGRGVPPPNNSTLRYCTQQIKLNPMMSAMAKIRNSLPEDENLLMLTGVRLGESAVRDRRILTSCSKNGGECGQGWFQNSTSDRTDTLAPIIHWRVCHVWEWLITGELEHGFPTYQVAEAYGGDEAQEINARTGCICCPLASKDLALDRLIQTPKWSYLAPLKELRSIYEEMRQYNHRLQKEGLEVKKDGNPVQNPNRKGPLKLESRLHFLDRILNIQNQINLKRGDNPKLFLIDAEEEARIRELIDLKTFPNKWTGDEPGGEMSIEQYYSDGSKQLILSF